MESEPKTTRVLTLAGGHGSRESIVDALPTEPARRASHNTIRINNDLEKAFDTDGDGMLDEDEIVHLIQMKNQGDRTIAHQRKHSTILAGLLAAAIGICIGSLTYGINTATETKPDVAADNTLVGPDGSSIVMTAQATEAAPMYVIPVLDDATINRMSSISMTVTNVVLTANKATVPSATFSFKIASYLKVSDTHAVLWSDTGDELQILNAEATLTFGAGTGLTGSTHICGASASCARVSVGGIDLAALQATARAALAAVNVTVADGGRRTRTLHCNPPNVGAATVAPTISCGQTVTGTTVGGTNVVGNAANDALFTFSLAEPTTVTFDGCQSGHDSYLRVLAGGSADVTDLQTAAQVIGADDGCLRSERAHQYATLLVAREYPAGNFTLVVEGYRSSAGTFSVQMQCATSEPTVSPTTSPTIDHPLLTVISIAPGPTADGAAHTDPGAAGAVNYSFPAETEPTPRLSVARTLWAVGETYRLPAIAVRGCANGDAANCTEADTESDFTFNLVPLPPGWYIDTGTGSILGEYIGLNGTVYEPNVTVSRPGVRPTTIGTILMQFAYKDTDGRSSAAGPHGQPCQSGGQRVDDQYWSAHFDGRYSCNCTQGYTGDNCEHSMSPTGSPLVSMPTSSVPTAVPSVVMPTSAWASVPSMMPTSSVPTAVPSTAVPSVVMPTSAWASVPSMMQTSSVPTAVPSTVPTSSEPTAAPSMMPTSPPISTPTVSPPDFRV